MRPGENLDGHGISTYEAKPWSLDEYYEAILPYPEVSFFY
jgi:hypothetical protein